MDTLIKAFSRVHKSHPGAKLIIVGEGDQKKKAEATCEKI